MDLLTGTGALVIITAATVGVLLYAIAGDRAVDTYVRPAGPFVAVLRSVGYAICAVFMAIPVDRLSGEFEIVGEAGLALLIALVVALVTAHRLRPRRASPMAVLRRAIILVAFCTCARYLTHLAGFPVDVPWAAVAVPFAALLVTATVFELAGREGVLHMVSWAFVALSMAGVVTAWALANRVTVFADPRVASTPTLWVMLLVEPLGVLAAVLLLIAMVRDFSSVEVLGRWWGSGPQRWRRNTPKTGEVWNAFVGFEEDQSEGKDRPVLVLNGGDGQVTALKITSQDKSRFPDYLSLPRRRCRAVLTKDSWLELRPVELPAGAFRSYRGRCPSWVMAEIRDRGLLTGDLRTWRLRSWLSGHRRRHAA